MFQTEKFTDDKYICVYHKDFNRFNNEPSNLKRMTWRDHRNLHTINYSYLKKWIDINGYYSRTLEGRRFMINRNIVTDIKNHKVIKIEILNERRDTCDITIKKYHNFSTAAGVIIHNSEDVRFARTIQRIQRIICSELTKIAIVHLYSQGYRDESLAEFELELTNPSTIFEREKIEIWADKVSVATDMVDNKFYSYDWVYKNIFHMSDDDSKEVKNQIIEDAKQRYRLTRIEEDGDDLANPFKKIGSKEKENADGNGKDEFGGSDMGGIGKSGKSGGLGGLAGMKDTNDKKDTENPETDKEIPTGEKNSNPEDLVKETKEEVRDQSGEHKATDHPFGEDPLGYNAINPKLKDRSEGKKKSEISHNYENGSPLSLGERKLTKSDFELISNLSEFLSKKTSDIKCELIHENGDSKSMMDVRNILEE